MPAPMLVLLADSSETGVAGGFCYLGFWALLYLFPAFVAVLRKHLNALPIFIINLFLGWTLIGWVVALAWACTAQQRRPRQPPVR